MILRLLLLGFITLSIFSRAEDGVLTDGATIEVGGAKITLTKLDQLPFVEDDYTKRFKFDTFDNPKLKELREKYKLDAVIAPGKDEFDKQVLLNEWTHKQFKKFGAPSSKARGALDILKAVEEGNTFFCAHYGAVLCSSAASLGWIDRTLALRRHKDSNKSSEHTVTEVWSNQYRKWVMLDPTSNLYVEKDGVPLNAFEIRQEWFYHDGKDISFVVGSERKKYKKADLPIFLGRFAGFGDLTFDPDEPEKYGFIGYVPNTNLMDAGDDYGKMFIIKDKLCDGTKWHERTLPKNPATDPYFPINQAALSFKAKGDTVLVRIQTMTPNFKEFRYRFDGKDWFSIGEFLPWRIRAGDNKLEVKSINQFGVEGPISTATIQVIK